MSKCHHSWFLLLNSILSIFPHFVVSIKYCKDKENNIASLQPIRALLKHVESDRLQLSLKLRETFTMTKNYLNKINSLGRFDFLIFAVMLRPLLTYLDEKRGVRNPFPSYLPEPDDHSHFVLENQNERDSRTRILFPIQHSVLTGRTGIGDDRWPEGMPPTSRTRTAGRAPQATRPACSRVFGE